MESRLDPSEAGRLEKILSLVFEEELVGVGKKGDPDGGFDDPLEAEVKREPHEVTIESTLAPEEKVFDGARELITSVPVALGEPEGERREKDDDSDDLRPSKSGIDLGTLTMARVDEGRLENKEEEELFGIPKPLPTFSRFCKPGSFLM